MSANKIAFLGIWALPFLFMIVLWGIFGYNGLYGQDGHEYLRYCRELLAFFQGAPIESSFFWPVGYPMFGAVLAFFLRSPELALILISLFSLGGTGWLTVLILKNLFPQHKFSKALFVLLFLTMSPFMMRGGLVVMSDILACFFLLGAFWYCLAVSNELKLRGFIGYTVFASLAFLTRYPAAFLLVLPSLWILFLCVKNGKATWLFGGAILATLCLSPQFLLRASGDFTPQHMELGWSVENFFRLSFSTTEGMRTYRLPNLLYAFGEFYHPGYIFAGLFLIPSIRMNDFSSRIMKMVLGGIILYSVFLAGMAYQNQRFLIISFPLVLLILYPAFSRIWEKHCPAWMKNRVWIGFLIVQSGLFIYGFNPILKRNILERQLLGLVKQTDANVIYTFDVNHALESYRLPGEIKNLWSEIYEDFEPGAAVLFNESLFSEQWEGYNPMINWGNLKKNYKLEEVDSLEGGWILYRIIKSEKGDEI